MKDNEGTKMEKHITDEKIGIGYTLHSDYYLPDLAIPDEEAKIVLGSFGMAHKKYIKENKRVLYSALLLSGRLNEYLHAVDTAAREMLDSLIEEYKKAWGVTEQLKAENQMEWVGQMNNIWQAVNEVVMNELIFI
jgi:hypothetical protein